MTIQIIRPADRSAWLAARGVDVTASVAGTLFGVDPYRTPYELWAEKTGRLSPDEEESEAMERGNLMEPVVVEMVRKRYPEWTVTYENDRAYYRDPERRIGATPDAFLVRPDRFGTGNMQIKTVSQDAFEKYWLDPDSGEVVPPLWIAVQTITEAQLTGCPWACVALVVLTVRGTLKLHVIDIPIVLKLWNRLVEKVGMFWAMVNSGQEPEPDWQRDGPVVLDIYRNSMPERRDLTDRQDIDELVGIYVDAKAKVAENAAVADRIRPQIIYALGTAEIGQTVNWQITARSSVRTGDFGEPIKTRVLRVKPQEIHSGSL
ncbi:YqaJ viral recombinase family protein [Aminobacter carboxidus]|uniref:YqaJ viral recombinase family protein n=1 Tax=Aminobacter carboxidus TaxID=376165 RepID=A0ABR9GWU7_9HYPH|nr:YqaJ viral recombinase family protein [Aminobacter carboxidus]MBE1208156.1 YqaJ viral recombinase family protein [Aminobacter carboxidus]